MIITTYNWKYWLNWFMEAMCNGAQFHPAAWTANLFSVFSFFHRSFRLLFYRLSCALCESLEAIGVGCNTYTHTDIRPRYSIRTLIHSARTWGIAMSTLARSFTTILFIRYLSDLKYIWAWIFFSHPFAVCRKTAKINWWARMWACWWCKHFWLNKFCNFIQTHKFGDIANLVLAICDVCVYVIHTLKAPRDDKYFSELGRVCV